MIKRSLVCATLLLLFLSLIVEMVAATPSGLTTLDVLILDTDGDGVLEEVQPGEPYMVREDLVAPAARDRRTQQPQSLLFFAHLTDLHVVDEESPMRGDFLDVCGPPLTGAFRPQETLSTQALNAMVRQVNAIPGSPVTGVPLALVIQTGDGVDNTQANELRWLIDTLDGGTIYPNSGAVTYDGLQTRSPYPDYPALIQDANRPFIAAGLQMSWYSVFGNHDGGVQGSFPIGPGWRHLALGDRKIFGLGFVERFCGPWPWSLLELQGQRDADVRTVPADRHRWPLSHQHFIRAHFVTQGTPVGHGFGWANLVHDRGYYSFGPTPGVQFLVLDSVNEDGGSGGSIDLEQLAWLEEQLIAYSSWYYDPSGDPVETGNEDSLLVLFSHHAGETLGPPGSERSSGDGSILTSELEALLHRFPNVILHVAGHLHENRVWARPDPLGWTQGYWAVNTAALASWPQQGRLLEIVDNGDGSLSIFSTIVDHSAPADPAQAVDPTPGDGVNELQLAAISRQVGFQDPQVADDGSRGTLLDRNVELLIHDPRSTPF